MVDPVPGRDAFTCAPSLRLQAHERLMDVRLAQVAMQIGRIEKRMEQLERRIWLTVSGVAGVVLSEFAINLLQNRM